MEYGSNEWYLYHHPANEKPIPTLIGLSIFLSITVAGIPAAIVLWIEYFIWAHRNNKALDKDPQVLMMREMYKKYPKNGDWMIK